MNCRDVTPLLSAERDGPLDALARDQLERHVAACPACRRFRSNLAEAAEAWRDTTGRATPPDPSGEWRTLRNMLRASQPGHTEAAPRRLPPWLVAAGSLPFAAAALWLAMSALGPAAPAVPPRSSSSVALAKPQAANPEPARADFVETPAGSSPVVFLDQESGWLIVWAESPALPASG